MPVSSCRYVSLVVTSDTVITLRSGGLVSYMQLYRGNFSILMCVNMF